MAECRQASRFEVKPGNYYYELRYRNANLFEHYTSAPHNVVEGPSENANHFEVLRNILVAMTSTGAVKNDQLSMSYDHNLGDRIRRYFDAGSIKFEAKQMMGGLCFLVNDKMCVGVEKAKLMVRIGPAAYDAALAKKGCHPMDFTGRPMRGFVFVDCEELTSERELEFWLELALAFNPMATKSIKKKKAT